MSKLPFLQFYPADYLVDTRVLTLSARGAWVDILCVLHSSSTRGTTSFPSRGWARIMGVSEADFEAALDEIMAMKVADVIRDGNASVTITCRRMMHEAITREQTRLRVQNHRNKERNAERNASGNAKVTPNKLEAISQKLETEEEKASVPAALLLASEDQPKPEKKFNAADAEIPAKLASPEFRSVWAEWCAYRREKGHTMKSRTAKAQLEKMAEWGEAQAIAAMRKSIMQGWQGVFPPTDNPNNRAPERSEFANAF